MPIRSLGNPSVRYNAVMRRTGIPDTVEDTSIPNVSYDWGGGRGINAGGWPNNLAEIEYITIENTGNGTDFGNLDQSRAYVGQLASDSDR